MSDDPSLVVFPALPGYRLVDCRRVGLPVFGVYIDVLTEEKRSLHLVTEYSLRLIQAGVSRSSDVIGLLGLDAEVVRVALADLLRARAITGGETELRIATVGSDMLAALGDMVCAEGTWFVPFDGILRKPFAWPRDRLLTSKQLRDAGCSIEIAPSGNRPTALELGVDEVSRTISELRPEKVADRLISVRNVKRAPLRFVLATALAYKNDSGMSHLVFLVDSRPLESHSAEFVRAGGMKRPMFRKLSVHDEEANDLRSKVRRRLTRSIGGPPRSEGRLTLASGADISSDALSTSKVHTLAEKLGEAMSAAKARFIVTSRGASSVVMDARFFSALERLLERCESVVVGLGPDVRMVQVGGEKLEACIEKLHSLRQRFPNLKVVAIPELRFTHLLVDTNFVVVGDYDWLAADGSRQAAFRERWFFEVHDDVAVDKEAQRFI